MEVIREFYEHLKTANMDGIMALLDDNVTWNAYENSCMEAGIPWHRKGKGKEEVRAAVEAFKATLEIVSLDFKTMFGSGSDVAAVFEVTTKNRSTGKTSTDQIIDHFMLTDGGKISSLQAYGDAVKLINLCKSE